MSTLTPCPSCNRHVRVGDASCPFCGSAVPVAAAAVSAPVPRGRLGRAALFAAGAALMGIGACTDSKCAHLTCSAGMAGMNAGGTGGTGGTTGAGGTTGTGGTTGAAGNDAGVDAILPTDGPVAIYSAVFPPPEETKTSAAVARTDSGKSRARS